MPMKCQHCSESWTKNPYLAIPTRMHEACSAWPFMETVSDICHDYCLQERRLCVFKQLTCQHGGVSGGGFGKSKHEHHHHTTDDESGLITGMYVFLGNICMLCLMSWNTRNMLFWLFYKIDIKSVISVLKLTCVVTVSVSVMDDIWRQQTVLRLLQLIELPLLESLLEGQESPRPPLHSMDSDPDLLYTSSYLDREILKAFSEAQYADYFHLCLFNCLIFILGCFRCNKWQN